MKKQIPFELLSKLEPVIQTNYDIIVNVTTDNTFYELHDRDPNSIFWFKVYQDAKKRLANPDSSMFAYEFNPINESKTTNSLHQGNVDKIIVDFKVWVNIIIKYNQTPSIHDDNFEKVYTEFYFSNYKFTEPEANIYPFDPLQQVLIEKYLDGLEATLIDTEETRDTKDVEDIKQEIDQIKRDLPTSTKNQVINRLAKVLAKAHKYGIKLAKLAIEKAVEMIVKKMIEGN